MGSFVQARYVQWRIVGKCSIHKNTLVAVHLSVSCQWLDFYPERLAFRLFLVHNLIAFCCFYCFCLFLVNITTAVAHYGCVINVEFNVGIEEKFLKCQSQQCTLD